MTSRILSHHKSDGDLRNTTLTGDYSVGSVTRDTNVIWVVLGLSLSKLKDSGQEVRVAQATLPIHFHIYMSIYDPAEVTNQ